jgi:hypothetical protein
MSSINTHLFLVNSSISAMSFAKNVRTNWWTELDQMKMTLIRGNRLQCKTQKESLDYMFTLKNSYTWYSETEWFQE